MHEDSKIAEAEYFLSHIEVVVRDRNATRFETSAFLTAARSILQYAREEASTKQGGQAWYDAAVAADAVVRFLKDHRDINVHERPLPLRTNITFHVGSGELKFGSTSATLIHSGSFGERLNAESLNASVAFDDGAQTSIAEERPPTYDYKFKGWTGVEDVLTLCTNYLETIKGIVADGRAKGFLTI